MVKFSKEFLKSKTEYLKSLMGYPAKAPLDIVYDSLKMESEASFDVGQSVKYDDRIEYQLLQTRKKLQASNLNYVRYGFLPSLQGFAAYNFNYLNNSFSELYNTNYPQSYIGLTLVFPIIHGGKSWMNTRQAKWQLKKSEWDIAGLESNINAQYAAAQASYNSSVTEYTMLKENLELAKEVYNVIQ